MIRRPPRSTQSRSSAASDVYKRQGESPASEQEAEPAPELTGRILSGGGFRDPALRINDMTTDTSERVQLPGDPEIVEAFWSQSGDSAYVLVETDDTGLIVEIGPDGEARRLGEALPWFASTADLGGSLLLATVCRRNHPSILVMDVEGRQKWKK